MSVNSQINVVPLSLTVILCLLSNSLNKSILLHTILKVCDDSSQLKFITGEVQQKTQNSIVGVFSLAGHQSPCQGDDRIVPDTNNTKYLKKSFEFIQRTKSIVMWKGNSFESTWAAKSTLTGTDLNVPSAWRTVNSYLTFCTIRWEMNNTWCSQSMSSTEPPKKENYRQLDEQCVLQDKMR